MALNVLWSSLMSVILIMTGSSVYNNRDSEPQHHCIAHQSIRKSKSHLACASRSF